MLISQRRKPGGRASHLSYGAWNEAEDVLATCTGTELYVSDRHTHSPSIRARRVLGRTARRVGGAGTLLPATKRAPELRSGDHVFFVAHGLWDLPLLERLRGLRRSGASVSVWISEVWPNELQDPRVRYECYSMIDHIFVAVAEAAEHFAEVAPSAEIHILPPAADVLRFAPEHSSASRGIDVLGIGRRDRRQHAEILEWSHQRQALYIYDTVQGQAADWREHRDALASLYRHSNVAICNYAKHDLPTLTGGLRVLPGRLFEGLAAGSILIGFAPDEDQQRKLIGLPVVENVDTRDVQMIELLDRFRDSAIAEPVRIRNLVLACRGHDWGHRWKTAFETVGCPVPFELQNRLDDLAKRADAYEAATDLDTPILEEPV